MKSTSRTLPTLLMLVTLSALAGCLGTRTVATDKSVCSIFPPITYSSADTPETVVQIRRHNAGYGSYCK
jgi:hypothetical protein